MLLLFRNGGSGTARISANQSTLEFRLAPLRQPLANQPTISLINQLQLRQALPDPRFGLGILDEIARAGDVSLKIKAGIEAVEIQPRQVQQIPARIVCRILVQQCEIDATSPPQGIEPRLEPANTPRSPLQPPIRLTRPVLLTSPQSLPLKFSKEPISPSTNNIAYLTQNVKTNHEQSVTGGHKK
jgi:hypothetical protein